MVKVDRSIIDEASLNLVGNIVYLGWQDAMKVKRFCKMVGITKGQWKRFNLSIRKDPPLRKHARVSALAAKKLEVIRVHFDNPHLETLLKIAEAQMEKSDDR